MSLAFAASCLVAMPAAFANSTDMPPAAASTPTDMVTNGPQADRGDHSRNWSAARNVRESQHYERLLATSPRFRMARMRKECGPITDQQLHQSCMASFGNGGEAMYGSSTPPRPISNAGGASQ
ncbi:MAG TPA: hypothetical protein VHW66_09560 [Stellaceae bacterium]|jgi:hypothetical protein|nr:hypothetical protein [Stellaceae bacterium]